MVWRSAAVLMLDAEGRYMDADPRALELLGVATVDELRAFRYPVVIGGGTPFLPPVARHLPLELIDARTFGSRVVYERYRPSAGDGA